MAKKAKTPRIVVKAVTTKIDNVGTVPPSGSISSTSYTAALTTDMLANSHENAGVDGSKVCERPSQNSQLLDMPKEVQLKIFRYAVKLDEPIVPIQFAEKSNKFLWSLDQLVDKTATHPAGNKYTKVVAAVPRLTVVALSQTCSQIYDVVARGHLFYQENHFDFSAMKHEQIITFLVALTYERRARIQHISLSFNTFPYSKCRLEMLTMVAVLKDLRQLDLFVQPLAHLSSHSETFEYFKGYKELLGAIEGLQRLKVHPAYGSHESEAVRERCKEDAATLENTLKAHIYECEKSKRAKYPDREINLREPSFKPELLRRAELLADLHIHGEGRLSNDKKPGIVSSRTRAAARNLEKLDSNGVIPRRDVPRYDLNGDLAWEVLEVKDSREVCSENGSIISIEFLVSISPRYDMSSEDSWEDVSVLNSPFIYDHIITFYDLSKHHSACGLSDILATWRLREDASESYIKERIRRLEVVEKKRAKKAELEAKKEQVRLTKAEAAVKRAAISKKSRNAPKKSGKGVVGSATATCSTASGNNSVKLKIKSHSTRASKNGK